MGSREPLASVSIPLPAGPLPSPADDIVPPLMNRPTTRSPLPGWMRVGQYIILGTDKVATIAYVCNGVLPGWTGRVMLGDGENRIGGDSLHSVQLAAEDAARAMVAEMAAALGGSVTWWDAQEVSE